MMEWCILLNSYKVVNTKQKVMNIFFLLTSISLVEVKVCLFQLITLWPAYNAQQSLSRPFLSVPHIIPDLPSQDVTIVNCCEARLLTLTFCPTEQSSHSEDGCVSHGSFSCHRKRWEQHQASHAGNRLSRTLSRFKQRQQCTGEKQSGKREVYTNPCLYIPMLCQAVHLQCQHENAHTNYFQVGGVGVLEAFAVVVEDEYKNMFSY